MVRLNLYLYFTGMRMKNIIAVKILILISVFLISCSSDNTKKANIPITDNNGSFIFKSKDTDRVILGADISNYDYDYIVDWGDGTIDMNITDSIEHIYGKKEMYIVKIRGVYPKLNTCQSISSLEQWGNIEWKDMSRMFWRCSQIVINATDTPNLKSVTSMSELFRSLSTFNQDISNWDVSNVKDMSYMFSYAKNFNQDISSWDVSNVKDMGYMFAFAEIFNQPIGKWNTSNVKDMGRMFWNAEKFDQDLSHWNISSVEYKERWLSTPGIGRFFGLDSMFDGVTLSTANYDALLQSWSAQEVHHDMYFGAGSSKYSKASKGARERLIKEHGWTIEDGGLE